MESELQLDLLKSLLNKYFPEIISQDPTKLSLNYLIQVISQHFSFKLNDDISDLLESLDVKYADVDTAISIMSKHVDTMAVLEPRELLIYKVLPCPLGSTCPKRPAEVVAHNEYMDKYLECPFFHHEKDRRRIVVESVEGDEEFIYKANYKKEENINANDNEDGSKNFYESLFHPIFYKLFQCKRKYCKGTYFCPFQHSEKEKLQWDEKFTKMTGKQRETVLKEKSYCLSVGSSNSISSHEEQLQRAFIEGGI